MIRTRMVKRFAMPRAKQRIMVRMPSLLRVVSLWSLTAYQVPSPAYVDSIVQPIADGP
jgi:hypothetical protein